MKALLLAVLLATPPVAAWMWRTDFNLQAAEHPSAKNIAQSTVRIPVEIVATGSASQVVYVEVPTETASRAPRISAGVIHPTTSRKPNAIRNRLRAFVAA